MLVIVTKTPNDRMQKTRVLRDEDNIDSILTISGQRFKPIRNLRRQTIPMKPPLRFINNKQSTLRKRTPLRQRLIERLESCIAEIKTANTRIPTVIIRNFVGICQQRLARGKNINRPSLFHIIQTKRNRPGSFTRTRATCKKSYHGEFVPVVRVIRILDAARTAYADNNIVMALST